PGPDGGGEDLGCEENGPGDTAPGREEHPACDLRHAPSPFERRSSENPRPVGGDIEYAHPPPRLFLPAGNRRRVCRIIRVSRYEKVPVRHGRSAGALPGAGGSAGGRRAVTRTENQVPAA